MSPPQTLQNALDRLASDDGYTARLAVANALDGAPPADLGLESLRVAILRDFTIEPLVPALRAELAAGGFAADIWAGGFDTIGQEALIASSGLDAAAPDLIIILRWLGQTAPDLATRFITLGSSASTAIRDISQRIEVELAAIRARTRAPIIVNTFPLPDVTTLGILDAQLETGHRRTIEDLNREILRVARGVPDVFVADLARLVGRIGSQAAIDERGWQTSRAPLGTPLILALAKEYSKFVRALRGRVYKCLVLDCDDTLWGGVVGEDGLGGIQLDPSYPGSAYLAFQREVLNLRERGILLAIVSKNNEADVLEVLRDHPHMQIRESHLAGWRINWQDKVANLVELAEELNIGVDSLVFVDDSAFERALVRERLPQVAVLELGTEPSRYAAKLAEAGLFDSLALTADDRARVAMVAADRERKAAAGTAATLEEFLISLEMEATFGPPGPTDIARIAQLTQKTNQFNLTTVRRTEGEIASLAADPATDVHTLRLHDRFSELGLVGVAIVGCHGDTAVVDTLLMSCRVLGRGVEDAFLAHIAGAATARGASRLQGTYIPTSRNTQVAAFFPQRGFRAVERKTNAGPAQTWELDLPAGNLAMPEWIKVQTVELP
jgi:FkbH-like protein